MRGWGRSVLVPVIMLRRRVCMKRSARLGKPEKIDIRGVASHARVSIATVSRTINKVPTVNSVLAARVWKAIEELDYTPNTQARALPSGKSRLLGLIVSEITNPFFPELIQEFEAAAVRHGYEILIGSTNYDPKTMETCVRRMLERKVEGVAVMTFGIEQDVLERFNALDVPLVCIDKAPTGPVNVALQVEYRAGIFEGVQHLAVLGHRQIAFISGPQSLFSAQSRYAAFLDSMQSVGIKTRADWLVEGDHTLEGGRDAMRRILAGASLPTAVMCSNDMTAIGVQHALFEANLRVPDDLSLIGFDDIHLAEYTIPQLTTVRMSCADLAQRAVGNLFSHMKGEAGEPGMKQPIATKLVVRQTTGLPKNALQDLTPALRPDAMSSPAEAGAKAV